MNNIQEIEGISEEEFVGTLPEVSEVANAA